MVMVQAVKVGVGALHAKSGREEVAVDQKSTRAGTDDGPGHDQEAGQGPAPPAGQGQGRQGTEAADAAVQGRGRDRGRGHGHGLGRGRRRAASIGAAIQAGVHHAAGPTRHQLTDGEGTRADHGRQNGTATEIEIETETETVIATAIGIENGNVKKRLATGKTAAAAAAAAATLEEMQAEFGETPLQHLQKR